MLKCELKRADGDLMGSEMFAVEAVGLRKAYGEKVAVGCLDLAVPSGSFFGVVGPNGAGKTTTLRMMTGLLRPDAGRVVIDGIDVWANPIAAKERIGVLPDDLRLFDRLTGEQFLTYIGRLRRMDISEATKRCAEVLELLGLAESAKEIVADYSQGMRKKVALGAAIMHVPKVLFLDEPFESVDPVSSRMVQEVLAKFRADGGTVEPSWPAAKPMSCEPGEPWSKPLSNPSAPKKYASTASVGFKPRSAPPSCAEGSFLCGTVFCADRLVENRVVRQLCAELANVAVL
jgi:ABC-2 type transport system ATP-binding protein